MGQVHEYDPVIQDKVTGRGTCNERIIALANELMRELVKAGYDVRTTTHPESYSNIEINTWNGKEIEVKNICREWQVRGAYVPAQPEGGK